MADDEPMPKINYASPEPQPAQGSWRGLFWVLASLIIIGIMGYFVLRIAGEGFPIQDSPYDPPSKFP